MSQQFNNARNIDHAVAYRDAVCAVKLCESVRPQHKAWTDELDAWLGVYAYLIGRQVEESVEL
jgi:hypothetical protein